MVQPDNTPAGSGADVEEAVAPPPEEPTPEAKQSGTQQAEKPEPGPSESADPDAEIVDAELVPTPIATTTPTSAVPAPTFDYTDAGVPTLGYLQDKIERRYGNALGGTELAEATKEAQTAAKAQEEREKAAADKLEEIRRSLHRDS